MIFLTDIMVLIWLVFVYHQGWRKGFLQIFFGPLSCFAGLALSWFIFLKTDYNPIGLFFSSIFFPLFIFAFLSTAFGSSYKLRNRYTLPSLPSSISGSLLNLIWGFCLLIPFFILITITPPSVLPMGNLRNNVAQSLTNKLIEEFVINQIPLIKNADIALRAAQDPSKLKKLQTSPEMSEFYHDNKIQDILNDAEIQKAVKDKDIFYLLENSKLKALWQDPSLKEKFTNLMKRITAVEGDPEYSSSLPAVE